MLFLGGSSVRRFCAFFFASRNIPNGEDGIDLVELVPSETQLFPHARNICVVEIGAIKIALHVIRYGSFLTLAHSTSILEKVHEAAECQDEEIQLLDQLALAWRLLVTAQVGNEAVGHAGGDGAFGWRERVSFLRGCRRARAQSG